MHGKVNVCRAPDEKTHGKVNVCRAPDEKRTANILTHGN
jgi:hypothetical protein